MKNDIKYNNLTTVPLITAAEDNSKVLPLVKRSAVIHEELALSADSAGEVVIAILDIIKVLRNGVNQVIGEYCFAKLGSSLIGYITNVMDAAGYFGEAPSSDFSKTSPLIVLSEKYKYDMTYVSVNVASCFVAISNPKVAKVLRKAITKIIAVSKNGVLIHQLTVQSANETDSNIGPLGDVLGGKFEQMIKSGLELNSKETEKAPKERSSEEPQKEPSEELRSLTRSLTGSLEETGNDRREISTDGSPVDKVIIDLDDDALDKLAENLSVDTIIKNLKGNFLNAIIKSIWGPLINSVEEAAAAIKNGAEIAAKETIQLAEIAVKSTKEAAEAEANKIKNAAKNVAAETKKAAEAEANKIKNAAKNVAAETKKAAEIEANKIKNAAKSSAAATKKAAETEANRIKNAAKGSVSKIKKWTGGLFGRSSDDPVTGSIKGKLTDQPPPEGASEGFAIDIHGNLMWLNILVRKCLGYTYIQPSRIEPCPSKEAIAQAQALCIVDALDDIIKASAKHSGISVITLPYVPYQFLGDIKGNLMANRPHNLHKLLNSKVLLLLNNIFQENKKSIFMEYFRKNLEHRLNHILPLQIPAPWACYPQSQKFSEQMAGFTEGNRGGGIGNRPLIGVMTSSHPPKNYPVRTI